MRRMQFDHVKTRTGHCGGGNKLCFDFVHFSTGDFAGTGVFIRPGIAEALTSSQLSEVSGASIRSSQAELILCVPNVRSGSRFSVRFAVDKIRQTFPRRFMLCLIEPGTAGGYSPLCRYTGHFSENQPAPPLALSP